MGGEEYELRFLFGHTMNTMNTLSLTIGTQENGAAFIDYCRQA